MAELVVNLSKVSILCSTDVLRAVAIGKRPIHTGKASIVDSVVTVAELIIISRRAGKRRIFG